MQTMILRMTGAVLIYVLLTALLRNYWGKSEKDLRTRLLVGVVFGVCAVVSTHGGVDYYDMIVNVRDLGPLAAGLFFSPVSGITAGLIGGVERYIAGTYWDVGPYTRVACGMSTCLAGFFAAALKHFVYKEKRASLLSSLLIGAVMEVFHMYAILFTHRDSMRMAYYIVEETAVPMIVFSGIGLMGCAFITGFLAGDFSKGFIILPREETPLAIRFQRWLLGVTVLAFMIDFTATLGFQKRMAYQDASLALLSLEYSYEQFYKELENDPEVTNRLMEYMVDERDAVYIVFDRDGKLVAGSYLDQLAVSTLSETDRALFTEKMKSRPYMARPEVYYGENMLCFGRKLSDGYSILVAMFESILYEGVKKEMYETTLSHILLFAILYFLIAVLVNTIIGRNLSTVNSTLHRIIEGELDETVNVRESLEFSALSDDINLTVSALRGYIDEAEKRMEEELKLAALIQEAALPRNFDFPREDFKVYAMMDPAKQVGGDFYDFFFMDSDHLVLVIADVSGKGIPAALFMMRSKTAISNLTRPGTSPADILEDVNQVLCDGNDMEMFVTVWIGIIDLRTGRMQCANAGHEYPMICRDEAGYQLFKDKHSLALGVEKDIPMHEYEIMFSPGDRLFVYTDGVPEANDADRQQYGTERLTAKLNSLRDVPQAEVLAGVRADIDVFAGKAEQFDDITMIGFTYLGQKRI